MQGAKSGRPVARLGTTQRARLLLTVRGLVYTTQHRDYWPQWAGGSGPRQASGSPDLMGGHQNNTREVPHGLEWRQTEDLATQASSF
ncbi:hypothetical protein RRG08_038688 [Elysia crispata]|uniref:Uncharacterized protein n=1 Tax=Elysia crispata TaxID=231223 RepID=A0AAE1DGY1_9GAST|nr:hypothetical protein RRG08_038688 [Elysia crispata]